MEADMITFDDLLENRARFTVTPKEGQSLPLGVTSSDLWDLWDVVVRQGSNNYSSLAGPGIQVRSGVVALEAYDFRGNGHGGRAGLSVFYYVEGAGFQGTTKGAFFFELENGIVVTWDRRVTVEIARTFIKSVDEALAECGELVEGVRAYCRPSFIFWKEWKFRGRWVYSVPDFPVIARKVWNLAQRLDAAEQGVV